MVLSGRSEERLAEVAAVCRERGARVELVAFDLADHNQREAAVRELEARGVIPEVLINNAGVSQRAEALETDIAVDRRVMEVNFFSAVHLTKAVLPAMRTNETGCIVAVSSIAGLLPSKMRSAYNAAKAAQISFFRTLGNELHRSGVGVSIVLPGFVRTEVSRNALRGDGGLHGVLDPNQAGGITPERAAADIVRELSRGKRVILTGIPLKVRLVIVLARIWPGAADNILRSVPGHTKRGQ